MPGAKEAKGMVCEKAQGNALDANGAGSASECPGALGFCRFTPATGT